MLTVVTVSADLSKAVIFQDLEILRYYVSKNSGVTLLRAQRERQGMSIGHRKVLKEFNALVGAAKLPK
jgi:hypothetical protein